MNTFVEVDDLDGMFATHGQSMSTCFWSTEIKKPVRAVKSQVLRTPGIVLSGAHIADRCIIVETLEESAARGDRRLFIEQVEAVDWSVHRPDELAKVIDIALSLDAPTLAINLAQRGQQLFPTDERIQRAARVLTPPTIRISQSPPTKGLQASRDWLCNHAHQYRGQWIAVCEGQLLGTARSVKELLTVIGSDRDLSSTIITEIL